MRGILLLLVCCLVGCKGKDSNQASGSATAGSGSAVVAAGSDSGSAIGLAMGSAGSAMGSGDGSAMGSASGSAAATPTGPTMSAKGGLSTLGKMMEAGDEDATAKSIEKKIGLPGVAASFDVMDIGGEVEREEGYISVKRGEKELVQLLRTMASADAAGPLAVVVWTDEVPTADGIKVGDTFATLVAKHPDVKCKSGAIAEIVSADILCRDPKEKELGYLFSPEKTKVKGGKVSPDTAKIIAIGHEF
jgi:hypothetical protein